MRFLYGLVCGLFFVTSAAYGTVLTSGHYTWSGSESTQTSRLFRDGVPSTWANVKSFPGTFGSATHNYVTFSFNVGANRYVQVATNGGTVTGFNIFFSVYANSYNPANQATNYLGDVGASPLVGEPQKFQVIAAAPHQNLVLVVSSVSGLSTVGQSFGFIVEGFTNPPECLGHAVHGHTITSPPGHGVVTSHEHHGRHGHVVGGCVPAGSVVAPGNIDGVVAVTEDGGVNIDSARADLTEARPSRRGSVLQLFGSAAGLFVGEGEELDATEFTAPVSGSPLYHTTLLPQVYVGNLAAKVSFSGLAPGLRGAWQINIVVPENAPRGSVPVRVVYDGQEVWSYSALIE